MDCLFRSRWFVYFLERIVMDSALFSHFSFLTGTLQAVRKINLFKNTFHSSLSRIIPLSYYNPLRCEALDGSKRLEVFNKINR